MAIKKHLAFHIGADATFPLEQRFFHMLTFFGGLISILTVIVNLIIGASSVLIIVSASIFVFSWSGFYISRFINKFNLARWILTLFLFGLFGYIFLINNGSQGPLLYLYMVFLLLILFVWDGRSRILFVTLFVLNITGFLLLEYLKPGVTKPYESESLRLLDVYLSYFLYIILMGSIMMFAKNGYVKEKLKAEQSDQLKSAFLANMSHEIRTPMNAILGFTQLLSNDLSKEKKDAYIKVIQDNGNSLLHLIEDIIDVSKIEAGELKIHEAETNVDALITDIISTFNHILEEFPEKQIEIKKELDVPGMVIYTDRTRLMQVFNNLMHNAIKYTERGEITIGYQDVEAGLEFFVKDSGQGIKQEFLEEIFDRFRKIETDRSKKIQPGTGIGLSISKNLAELLGGEMSVESVYGRGSKFYFTLPCQSIRFEAAVKLKSEKKVIEGKDFTGRTILVAEDENANFFFLKKVLERSGADVIRARNGREAVALMEAHPEIDFVLMDILMPEMNGYEATEIIKRNHSDIPVIAQTALAMEGDAEKVMSAGCDGYISKPIRMKELLDIISSHIEVERVA